MFHLTAKNTLWGVVLATMLFFSGKLNAQTHLNFDALSVDDGFSSSRATAILQDRAGFMWVGTWNGLNRYDGYECVLYQSGFRDSVSLSNREITALAEDHLGNIWVGTTFGLNRLNPVLNKIERFPFETRILSLIEDKNHKIWVGTLGDGLYKLDPASGQKQHYLESETVNAIFEDSRNEFWIATNNGLFNFDRETASYKHYIQEGSKGRKLSGTAHCIAESSTGILWVGFDDGLVKIIPNQDRDKLQFIDYLPNQENQSPGSVERLCLDKNDNLWIATWGSGLFMLPQNEQHKKTEDAIFLSFSYDIYDPFSFKGANTISSLYIDRNSTLWVGGSFINIAKIDEQEITRYNTQQIVDGIVVNNRVRTIGEDKNGRLLLGSGDGLLLYNTDEQLFRKAMSRINFSTQQISSGHPVSVGALMTQFDDEIWIGTDDLGLFIVPRQNLDETHKKPILNYNRSTKPPVSNSINFIKPSHFYKNTVWLGTGANGIIRCTIGNNSHEFRTFTVGAENGNLSDNHIRCLLEDSKGIVWIGTQYGLNRLDPVSGKCSHYFFSRCDTSSINDNVINVIFEDSEQNLWIGTNTGLNKKIETKANDGTSQIKFKAFAAAPWINKEIVLNILEDGHKNLWVGIYNGIVKFNTITATVEFEYFDKAYSRIKIDQNSCYKDEQGRFLFGGGNGFLRFHPDSIQKSHSSPDIQITGLWLLNQKALVSQGDQKRAVLSKSISYTDSLVFNHSQRVFTFDFSAMDYTSLPEIKYAYKLEGYDEEWNNIGERNTATYTNIPHGNYVFKVKACNSHGVWSERPKTIFLQIKPPFWKTNYAYTFYILVIIGLLYFFNRFSIIAVKEKSRLMLGRIRYEKEHELNELKVHFFTNITHEFRTPLTLILGPLEELLAQKEKFRPYSRNLELIQRNANRLLRLINQLMEFRKVEKDKVELFLQEVDVVLVLNEIYDSFKNLADSKKIDFSLHYEQNSILAWIDLDKFDKVIYNLLSNAFKFTNEGGKISIRLDTLPGDGMQDRFCIEIEDSGIGIAADKKELVFERFYQVNQRESQSTGGIGLYLSKAFIELHNGKIELESEPGKGSCFKVILPFIQNKAATVESGSEHKNGTDSATENHSELPLVAAGENNGTEILIGKSSIRFQNKNRPYVLLAEDDLDMNEFICRSLSTDFKIKCTYTGKEALEIAKRTDPDLILSDIMMPEMDGIEMGRLLKADINTSHIPVLYLTAKTAPENEVEGLLTGAVDYICKPFSIHSLRIKINNILALQKDQHEKYRLGQLLEPEAEQLSSLDDEFLKKVMAAIDKNIDNSDFDVEALSREVGLSSNQTYRKLKALTGQTAKEFIRNLRLKTAAKLLLQNKRSVSEIIYMVGFSNPSYFSRCFREYFNCSPSEYIEKGGKN